MAAIDLSDEEETPGASCAAAMTRRKDAAAHPAAPAPSRFRPVLDVTEADILDGLARLSRALAKEAAKA
jgi:acetylornithine/succinyldiaminopimelate/putrescine aminotransferase